MCGENEGGIGIEGRPSPINVVLNRWIGAAREKRGIIAKLICSLIDVATFADYRLFLVSIFFYLPTPKHTPRLLGLIACH